MSAIMSRLRRKKKSIRRISPNKLKPHAAIKAVAKAVDKAVDVVEDAVEAVSEVVEKAEEVVEKAAEVVEKVEADLSILEGSITSLREALETGAHDAGLKVLLEAEKSGKNRKGAIAALTERL